MALRLGDRVGRPSSSPSNEEPGEPFGDPISAGSACAAGAPAQCSKSSGSARRTGSNACADWQAQRAELGTVASDLASSTARSHTSNRGCTFTLGVGDSSFT